VLNIQTAGTTAISIDASQAVSFTNAPTVTGGTANGVAYLNGSKVLTTGSALVFDGTNLGVGVTPTNNTLGKTLQVGQAGAWVAESGTNRWWLANNWYYNSGDKYINNGFATLYSQQNGSHQWQIAASGTAGNAITFTQAMTLDASGNLGVGATSGFNALSGTETTVYIKNAGANIASLYLEASRKWAMLSGTAGQLAFYDITGSAERCRIDSSGNLLVGGTTALAKFSIYSDLGGVGDAQAIKDTGSAYGSGAVYIKFQNNAGSTAGKIEHTASTTVNYNTASDERLKTNIGVATDTSVIDQVVIHDFEWKEDGRIDRGVFAQQAHQIKPSAVSVGTDETNNDGVLLNPWSIDYSKFVPDLIVHAQQLKKQVQEQQALITTLTARITALESA
jgi:hypothetical protein